VLPTGTVPGPLRHRADRVRSLVGISSNRALTVTFLAAVRTDTPAQIPSGLSSILHPLVYDLDLRITRGTQSIHETFWRRMYKAGRCWRADGG
jgi:hypothetical protein